MKHSRKLGKVAVALALGSAIVLGWQNITAQGFGKLDAKLSTAVLQNQPEVHDVMVKLKQQVDLSQFDRISDLNARRQAIYKALTSTALKTQAPVLAYLQSNSLKFRPYYIANMVLGQGLSIEQIRELAARSDVEKIFTDADLAMLPTPIDVQGAKSFQLTESNIQSIGAEKVWNEFGIKGQNIVIAGQDTGVEWDHPALIRQYRGSKAGGVDHNYNWYDAIREPVTGGSSCGYASDVPCDDNAHGTHTVGTVVGNDGGANQIGVAPDAQWIACRNMDAGTGRPHTYLTCFEYFLAPFPAGGDPMRDGRPELAPNVMNNSWGCPDAELCRGDVLLGALQTLKAAGVFVVVSAGNDGPDCKTIQDTPAWHSADTFSIGAYDHRSGRIAGFSSRGPSAFDGAIGPDIVAPGVSIRSSVPGHKYDGAMWSGTSMAGPHAVGVVTLMWSAQPSLIGKIKETIDILTSTADPVPSAGCMDDGSTPVVPNNYYGYGRINAYKAVKAAMGR